MRLPGLEASHAWSQDHLSHYVEGDLGWLARRRLELHAEDCPDCSRGIKALRALVRLMGRPRTDAVPPAPTTIFDRVRAEASDARADPRSSGSS
jgi:anti-sigma factor RsiW